MINPMATSSHSLGTRCIAIVLATIMPLCCCVVNAAVPTGSLDESASTVRACCHPGGCTPTDSSNPESDPGDDRCGCIKVFGTLDAGLGDLLAKLGLPLEAYDTAEIGPVSLETDPANVGPPLSRAGPEPDGPCPPQGPRELRQRLMLHV